MTEDEALLAAQQAVHLLSTVATWAKPNSRVSIPAQRAMDQAHGLVLSLIIAAAEERRAAK